MSMSRDMGMWKEMSMSNHGGHRQSSSRRQQKLEEPPARFVFSQETFPVRRPEPLLSKARKDISAAWINSTAAPVGRASQQREAEDEGDRGDGSGCGNGRDEA